MPMSTPSAARYQPGALNLAANATALPLPGQPDGGIVLAPELALAPLADFCFLTQVSNAGGSMTWVYWRIVAWPKPHSSPQTTSYLPSLDGVSRMCVVSPGTASCLRRNDGTQKECRTSFVTMSNA